MIGAEGAPISQLPFLIPQEGTVLLSDFDETLCSRYQYDPFTRNHQPQLDRNLLLETQRIISPLFIATSRSSSEDVVKNVLPSLLGGRNLPIICENGSILFFPNGNQQEVPFVSVEQ